MIKDDLENLIPFIFNKGINSLASSYSVKFIFFSFSSYTMSLSCFIFVLIKNFFPPLYDLIIGVIYS